MNDQPDTRLPTVGGDGDYVVAVLIEQPFRGDDAKILTSLHEGLEGKVVYHVLLPREEAPAVLESTLGSLNAGDLMGMPPVTYTPEELEEFRQQASRECAEDLAATVSSIEQQGQSVFIRNFLQFAHRRCTSPKVNADDAGCARRNHLADRCGIQVVRCRIDISENGSNSLPPKCMGSSNKRV